MSDAAENHTIKLLQEMRAEINDRFTEMEKRFDAIDDRFDGVDIRIDGLTHMITLLAANMGGHEQRIETLEETMAELTKGR